MRHFPKFVGTVQKFVGDGKLLTLVIKMVSFCRVVILIFVVMLL